MRLAPDYDALDVANKVSTFSPLNSFSLTLILSLPFITKSNYMEIRRWGLEINQMWYWCIQF